MNADTHQFLALLSGRLTFQTFDDRKARRSLAQIHHAIEPLQRLNAQGAGVFVMVNEGDGEGRSNENVTRVRAVFVDYDGGELPETFLLPPHAITETSPGKFHVYWLVSDFPLDNSQFNAVQESLARTLGAKPDDAKGLARVMRLPGFIHHKGEAFRSRLAEISPDLAPYTTAQILAAYPLPARPVPAPAPVLMPSTPGGEGLTPRRIMEVMLQSADLGRGRNNLAFRLACQIRDNGHTLSDAEGVMREFQSLVGGAGEDLFTLDEALHAARSAFRHPPRQPWTRSARQFAPNTAQIGAKLGLKRDEETGFVTREPDEAEISLPEKPTLIEARDLVLSWFAEQGAPYRFVQRRLQWFQYVGGVYELMEDELVRQRVDLVLQGYGYDNFRTSFVDEVIAKIGRQEEIAIRDADLDPWLLNVKNGILDLRTGDLHPHTPEFFSTVQSDAAYDPTAYAHDWIAFIRSALPDPADRRTLQQFLGYCLTGDTSAQAALLLIGEGGTGKGTIMRVIARVLGSLATGAALENIEDGSFLVGTLVGRRMVTISELQKHVNWLPFKRITGEDLITVDVKNKTPYTIKLDAKLVILSNVLPHLGDDATNTSLTRRFVPISFNVKPSTPDPTLERRLSRPEELSGILNWLLEGLRSLEAQGMTFPNAGLTALGREIVEESNRVIEFLRDSTAPRGTVAGADLYATYSAWCSKNNHRAVAGARFPRDLIAAAAYLGHEVTRTRTSDGILYTGVTISAVGGWEK